MQCFELQRQDELGLEAEYVVHDRPQALRSVRQDVRISLVGRARITVTEPYRHVRHGYARRA